MTGKTKLAAAPSGSIVDAIIQNISANIVKGHLQPGQRIPTEPMLTQSMGVGRNSLREAIKILVAMGVLEIRRADGTYVAADFSPRMLDPLVYGVILGSGNAFDLMDLRRLVETGGLRLAAERRKQADVDALERQFDKLRRSVYDKNIDDIVADDVSFHRLVIAATGNPLLSRLETVLEEMTMSIRRNAAVQALTLDGGQALLARHLAIYRIVAEQDETQALFIGEELFHLLERLRMES